MSNNLPMTAKQGSLLFRMTGFKLWQPVNLPAPDIKQATSLVALGLKISNQESTTKEEQAFVQNMRQWFPEYTLSGFNHFKKAEKVEKVEQPVKVEDMEQPETEAELETNNFEKVVDNNPNREIFERLEMIIKSRSFLPDSPFANIWLHGPAGTGKTTICRAFGNYRKLPVTIISCNSGTQPSEFKGASFPKPKTNDFLLAIQQPGIIVLDELTGLDDSVASMLNALLANGEIMATTGRVVRHKDAVIIATSNITFGTSKVYRSNNLLDGATQDRFVGNYIHVDYSRDYEAKTCEKECCEFAWKLREVFAKHHIDIIVSTRAIQSLSGLKRAGMKRKQWVESLVNPWPQNVRDIMSSEGLL